VLKHALVRTPDPVEWDAEADEAARLARMAPKPDEAATRPAH